MTDQVAEFNDVAMLNEWLSGAEKRGNIIKKIFRSPDKVYFVWYEI
jgi:hypothetical protein